MPKTVFLSWQADRPPIDGRNFLERCLEKAIGGIAGETTLTEAERDLVVDRDTKGVPGSPGIVDTIFKKIDEATVFVGDLTFVGERADGRPMPNPNVLIEYGRAQLSVGQKRIIAVMNTAYGAPSEETLPFNLRHLLWPIQYELHAGSSPEARSAEKDRLAKVLRRAIVACIENIPEPMPPEPRPFVPHETGWKPGFFRPEGVEIGVSDGRFGPGVDVRLDSGPAVWLRLMPRFDPGRTWGYTALRQTATRTERPLLPLVCGGGLNYVRGEDGFGMYVPHPAEGPTCSVVYCFNTGEVWAVDTYSLAAWAEMPGAPIPWMKGEFNQTLPRYGEFLMDLGIKPPYRWEAGMSGLKGRVLRIPNSFSPFPHNICTSQIVEDSGTYCPGDSVMASLKPFYDKLYEACGLFVEPA